MSVSGEKTGAPEKNTEKNTMLPPRDNKLYILNIYHSSLKNAFKPKVCYVPHISSLKLLTFLYVNA